MSSNIVTFRKYESEVNLIEKNLRENIDLAEKILNDFKDIMDSGNLADQSLCYVLNQNLSNAKIALNNFISLPISGQSLF